MGWHSGHSANLCSTWNSFREGVRDLSHPFSLWSSSSCSLQFSSKLLKETIPAQFKGLVCFAWTCSLGTDGAVFLCTSTPIPMDSGSTIDLPPSPEHLVCGSAPPAQIPWAAALRTETRAASREDHVG